MPTTFQLFAARDGDTFTDTITVAETGQHAEEAAQGVALLMICTAFRLDGTTYAEWYELAADLDGVTLDEIDQPRRASGALPAAVAELLDNRAHLDLHADDRRMLRAALEATPALAIEVSAVRGLASGQVETCNAFEASAEAFAVYIRAPLALHVRDFTGPDHEPWTGPEMHDAKRAAFAWAGHLAEHLGCEVESFLNLHTDPATGEHAPYPVELAPVSVADLIDAAACLWEAALEAREAKDDTGAKLRSIIHRDGVAALRNAVTGWAEACHRAWEHAVATEGYDDCFDWEWCPQWLADKLATI